MDKLLITGEMTKSEAINIHQTLLLGLEKRLDDPKVTKDSLEELIIYLNWLNTKLFEVFSEGFYFVSLRKDHNNQWDLWLISRENYESLEH